jgi:hypothetical protein
MGDFSDALEIASVKRTAVSGKNRVSAVSDG